MKHLLISLLLLLSISTVSQSIEVVTFEELEKRWDIPNDTLYLINYWATWCMPCVEELPEFIKLDNEMEGKAFKMILVSLDFPKHIDGRVIPFLKKNNITQEVVILDDDANVWINKINPDWDGAIPATHFIKNKKREFYGEQLSYEKLKEIVNTINLKQ